MSTDLPSDAQLFSRTIAMPADTNPSGDIFGGWLMSQMDLAGGTLAIQEAHTRVATVAVDSMSFLRPVKVGDEVSCYCRLLRRGRTSLMVHVESWVRRSRSNECYKVTEAAFTFVSLDEGGKPQGLL